MRINKLAFLVVSSATPLALSESERAMRRPKRRASNAKISCYASTSLLSSQGEAGYHPSPAASPGLRHGGMRQLSEAEVISYNEGSWELKRDEVVKAVKDVIAGDETNFQLNEMMGETLQVLLIEEDGMTISTEDLDGEFTLVNAFIKKSPDVEYQVDCPANDGGDKCTVKEVKKQDEDGNDLVTCFADESTITKEDIPAECGEEMYDMALYALPGPHFILAGTKSIDLDLPSSNTICPKSIAFSTADGRQMGKQIVSPYMEDIKDLPKHSVGVAALADVLEAEDNAEAIDEASYDMATNNCVSYASSIWRRLGFDHDNEEMANFVIHNIMIDESQLEKLASEVGVSGRRLLKAIDSKRLENFVKNAVFSHFNLK